MTTGQFEDRIWKIEKEHDIKCTETNELLFTFRYCSSNFVRHVRPQRIRDRLRRLLPHRIFVYSWGPPSSIPWSEDQIFLQMQLHLHCTSPQPQKELHLKKKNIM